jgi:putative redox protein
MRSPHVVTGQGKFQQRIEVGPNTLLADEELSVGGTDTGPAPHELLLSALGACTSMTVKVYADRKGWPLESVDVKVSGDKKDDAFQINVAVELHGPLDEEQRKRLLEIAGKCPVHRTLTSPIRIDTSFQSTQL